MKKLLLLALGAIMAGGCAMVSIVGGPQVVGSGRLATVDRHVNPFKRIDLAGAMDVEIVVGGRQSVKLTGDDNLVPLVKTEVSGGTLKIYQEGNTRTNHPLKVELTVPTLDGAGVTGSGAVLVHRLKGPSVDLSIRGSGSITADGTVRSLSAGISGSGDLKLFGLKSHDAKAKISGSGDIEVTASDHLEASISGSGDIRFRGRPAHVSKSVSGSGEITQVE